MKRKVRYTKKQKKEIGRKIKAVSYTDLRKRLKRVFSLYIRKSRPKHCELHHRANQMGVEIPVKCSGSIQCCHKIPVSRSRSIEFDERNVYRGCSSVNMWEPHNRDLWMAMWPKVWPEDVQYLALAQKAGQKKTADDLKTMLVYYESKLSEFD